LDHVDHAISVVGIEHVGLGGDFLRQIVTTRGEADFEYEGMRADAALAGLPGPEEYPALVAALRERGYAGADLEAILGGNMIRLLRRGLPAD
jgi:membrane dipeptidase